MAWIVTANDTRRRPNYDGHGAAGRFLEERFADQPSAHRRAQQLVLPGTRWDIASVKEEE